MHILGLNGDRIIGIAGARNVVTPISEHKVSTCTQNLFKGYLLARARGGIFLPEPEGDIFLPEPEGDIFLPEPERDIFLQRCE
jgi:hypothetical protein